jgi:tRNA pseudouridine38-40 synthase
MPRYRLLIEYDGRPYHGYQAQIGLPSVQGALLAAITGFSGEAPVLYAAGRTDTGVHATGQVVHFNLDKAWRPAVVLDAVNAHLWPQPVAVLDVVEVDDDFHARHSARARRYLFRILNRRAPATFDRGRVWHVKKPLDAEAMHAAAQDLIGHHDFTTFRDAQCQARSPMRTMDEVKVWRDGLEVHLTFTARSFLHRQVRSMTGSLVEVGVGRWPVARIGQALAAADRKACGTVAPPDGLYLSGVDYA